jgi:hypothetical protein
MLVSYTYVPHQMEKMQEFIDFIFFEVWCKAADSGPFDLNLFAAKPELQEVMLTFFYTDTQGGDFFYEHVERIYGLFATLDDPAIDQFKRWYRGNNDIEKVCLNDPATQLVRYTDIPAAHKNLSDELSSFFRGLYSQSLLDLAALRAKIGDIDDHYKTFVKINNAGKCPFCGISDLYGEYHSKREAYDHYLPKALYPFNSINLRNLVPACHDCNSSYKTSKDPARPAKDPARGAQRRKVFYPYCTNTRRIEIAVAIAKADVSALSPQDIGIHFGPAALVDEIDTWRDVYGIDERYKAKVLGDNDGKYWITQVLDEWNEEGKSPDDFLRTLARQTLKNPLADANFLKMPFLEACRAKGVF